VKASSGNVFPPGFLPKPPSDCRSSHIISGELGQAESQLKERTWSPECISVKFCPVHPLKAAWTFWWVLLDPVLLLEAQLRPSPSRCGFEEWASRCSSGPASEKRCAKLLTFRQLQRMQSCNRLKRDAAKKKQQKMKKQFPSSFSFPRKADGWIIITAAMTRDQTTDGARSPAPSSQDEKLSKDLPALPPTCV